MNAQFPRILRRNGWSSWHVLRVVIMAMLGVMVTSDAWVDIYHLVLRDGRFHTMYLVPAVVMILIWVRRGRLRLCLPGGAAIGPSLVAIGWAMSSMGYRNAIESLWHIGSLVVVIGCVLSVLGRDVLVHFMPAFVAMVFMVPMPGAIRQWLAHPLHTAIAASSEWLLAILGLPAVHSTEALFINGVAPAQADSQMLLVLVLAAYTFAFSLPLRGLVRAAILITSPLLAILSAVMVTVISTGLTGLFPLAGSNLQWLSAWMMLSVTFLLLISFLWALRWAMVPVTRFTLARD